VIHGVESIVIILLSFEEFFIVKILYEKHYRITSAGNKILCILKHTNDLVKENGGRERERNII